MPLGASSSPSLLFGLVPALHASRRDSGAHLKEGGRTGIGRRPRRPRPRGACRRRAGHRARAAGRRRPAGPQSHRAEQRGSGFCHDRRAGAPPRPAAARRMDEPARIAGFYEQLIERLDALPGVESAAAGSSLLLSRLPGSAQHQHRRDGRRCPPMRGTFRFRTTRSRRSYFSTLQIPLRRGRMFTRADAAAGPASRHRQRVVRPTVLSGRGSAWPAA